MLLWLLTALTANCPAAAAALNAAAMGKITFRAALAAVASFGLALLLGPRLIAWLDARFREPNVSDSPRLRELHQAKQWTPTMGGLFIILAVIAAIVLFGDWQQPYLGLVLLLIAGLAALGAIDDLTKLSKRGGGISARAKLCGQVAVAMLVAIVAYRVHSHVPDGLSLSIPLWGDSWQLGWLFVPLAVLVIVGSSNAVNLTDGLDGLAGGCLISASSALAVMAYASGHAEWAAYLRIAHIPGAGELVIVAAAMIGAVLGFLWFNCHPAQVFMGDTGSLPLGGLLGLLAVITRQELLLLVVGGVFIAEAGSVILQVVFYKWKRRRIFLCAPLHHHFQFKGWPESKIVVRFWIVSALCAILGLAGLKLQARKQSPTGELDPTTLVRLRVND